PCLRVRDGARTSCKRAHPTLIGALMAVPAERARVAGSQGRRRARHRAPRSVVRDRLEYGALRAVVGILAALPLWVALRLGEVIASLAYLLDVPHRRIGMRNLALAFPDR